MNQGSEERNLLQNKRIYVQPKLKHNFRTNISQNTSEISVNVTKKIKTSGNRKIS